MASRTKTLKLDITKEVEAELWDYLQSLPHGEYTKSTKEYWMTEMNKEKIRQMRKELGK